ncbi:MAG: HD-GYP domain-containing protein [Bacillota bacterium]
MSKKLKIYLSFIFSITLFTLLYLTFKINEIPDINNIILFSILFFISHNASLFIISSSKVSTSIKLPIILPGLAIIGTYWTALLMVLFLFELKKENRPDWYKSLFNRSNFFLSIIAAGVTFNFVENYFQTNFVFVSFLLAAISYYIVNNLLVYIVLALSQDVHPENIFKYYSNLIKNVFVSYIAALIFYAGYLNFGSIFLILSLILIYIVKDFFYSKLQQMNTVTQVVESFLKVIDSKDDYTEGHCQRVSEYTGVLCRKAGLKYNEIEKIVNMAKIHDIGKISVSDDILKSSGKLTESEFAEMKKHSKYGCEILDDLDIFKEDIDIIKYHHERYDGNGYPEGLSEEEIPLGSRILSICDAYDVMSTGRVYKPPLNKEEIIAEFNKCAGEQFDPNYAEMMVELIQNNRIGGLN